MIAIIVNRGLGVLLAVAAAALAFATPAAAAPTPSVPTPCNGGMDSVQDALDYALGFVPDDTPSVCEPGSSYNTPCKCNIYHVCAQLLPDAPQEFSDCMVTLLPLNCPGESW